MRKEHLKELSVDPKFISGIYNYCDRWCERCAFTSRCMSFVLHKEQCFDPESRDVHNELFRQNLAETLRLTHDLLEETLEQHNIDLDAITFEAAQEQERATHNEAESHACSLASKQYGTMLDEWFERHGNCTSELCAFSRKHASRKRNADLEESLEILHWYQHQIHSKIMRAVSGHIEERSQAFDEKSPKDSDGSAKVALLGIDRSILAWMVLREELPEHKDESIDFLLHLDRQRKQIEQHFPDARAFIRPGFDEMTSQ